MKKNYDFSEGARGKYAGRVEKRDIGSEILRGIRELKKDRTGRMQGVHDVTPAKKS